MKLFGCKDANKIHLLTQKSISMIVFVPITKCCGVNVQSWPKYMKKTLELVQNSALREKFNFNFRTVFC